MPLRCCLFAPLLAIASGCGPAAKPAAVPATGKVMFKKNTPAAGALVVFHPANEDFEKRIGGKPVAKAGDDGTFVLTTYEKGDGAPEGEYGVTVDWRKKDPKVDRPIMEGGGTKSVIAPRFGNPNSPFTKVTVKKGEANVFEFDVE